jgi:hypothetical protein
VLLSSTTIQGSGSRRSSFLVLKGNQAAIDELVELEVLRVAAQNVPLFLIEPEKNTGNASSAQLTPEEITAQATWGVAAVNALDTHFTGEGVKVGMSHNRAQQHWSGRSSPRRIAAAWSSRSNCAVTPAYSQPRVHDVHMMVHNAG